MIRPLLRWAGGKRKLSPTICDLFPENFWSGQGRYCEPFLGGAAVALEVANRRKSSGSMYLTDCNEDLINLYLVVQNRTDELVDFLNSRGYTNTAECYYKVRAQRCNDDIERAARMLYLNATCFNGLYRQNLAGCFNVPFGNLQNPDIQKSELIRELAVVLKNTLFETLNFGEALTKFSAKECDVVYFDPPYLPLSVTASFTSYSKNGFGLKEQQELAELIQYLVKKNVSVILSNSDTSATHEIFKDTGLRFFRVTMGRSISANASSRKNVYEILATNINLDLVPSSMEPVE